MLRLLVTAAVLIVPAAGSAQAAWAQAARSHSAPAQTVPVQAQAGQAQDDQAQTGQPPQRIRSVQVQPGQSCPKGTDNEVVVCSTVNPDEQFRIPTPLRNTNPGSAEKQSWANRAATIDEVGREAGGLPGTCSPVGSGGQTGCTQRLLRESADARRNARIEGTTP